jgi:hypothetical protein
MSAVALAMIVGVIRWPRLYMASSAFIAIAVVPAI